QTFTSRSSQPRASRGIVARDLRAVIPRALWIQRLAGEPFWERKSTSVPSTAAALRAILAVFGNEARRSDMRLEQLIAAASLLSVATVGLAKAGSQGRSTAEHHVMVAPDEIKWQPIPPSWADGPP